jgi:hypothetical protein
LACTELTEVKATGTGKLLDSLPRNNVVAEPYSGKLIVAYTACITFLTNAEVLYKSHLKVKEMSIE